MAFIWPILQWCDLYRYEMERNPRNPRNPSAAGRADLLQTAVDLLK
ncbi:MAG: hypothetical protein O7G88_02345 [bacterium]|nr:hypothetical protein [bacterium]